MKFYTTINEFKQYLNENIEDMLHINLLDRYSDNKYDQEIRQKFKEYKSKIKGFKTEHMAFKVGDIIEFTAGYNDDIRYTTEILGFDEDGDIYLLWQSYWFPIRNEAKRAIKLINNVNESNNTISKLNREISTIKDRLKNKWKTKGGYENFGDTEYRKLKDKYSYNPYGNSEEREIAAIIDRFDDWAMNFTGESKVNENKINLNNLTIGDKIVIYNKRSDITYNSEFIKIENNRIYFKNLDYPSTGTHNIIINNDIEISIKTKVNENIKLKKGDKVKTRNGDIETVLKINSNGNVETEESDYTWPISSLTKINENVDTTQLPKALEDIDERRPNRMKRPDASGYGNDFAGRGGVRGHVYIQDEAEGIMQDKYGRERGTRLWEASINAPQRGAMFKMCDDVMKEKSFLYHQANIYPRDYWEVSYFALWKLWMESQGLTYKIDSDEDVANKKAEKERQLQAEKDKIAKDKKDKEDRERQTEIDRLINNIDPSIKPDSKDHERIQSLMTKNDPERMAKNMANSIKDKNKAIKRGLAMIDYIIQNKKSSSAYYIRWYAKPFFDRANEL